MKKLKASIVTPVYNAEDTLLELFDGLKRQTEKDFEWVIVDDGSKDNSLSLLRSFKAKFPIKIISQKNSGPAVARNVGAKNAKSEIIIFLDSDCEPRVDFVEKIIQPFSDLETVGVQAETETKNTYSLIARYVSCEIYYRHEFMKKNQKIDHISTCACAYRKKDFGNGFLTDFKKADMEDVEFSYRLAKENKTLVFQPSAIVKHYHPEGFWNFMKIQFSRGYWRALGHKKHPEKMIKDSYMGYDMIVQGGLSFLFLMSILTALILDLLFVSFMPLLLPLLFFVLIVISNFPFGIYSAKYETKMLFFAPLIASCRSVAGTLGFLKGFFSLFLKK